MSGDYFYGQTRNNSHKRGGKLSRPAEQPSVPDTGRIVKLLVGQGHGFIRLANDREIFFHRADVHEGTSINDLAVGDVVTFRRLDDPVSGTRALCVKRLRRRR
jgi:cold shock CspA family protein